MSAPAPASRSPLLDRDQDERRQGQGDDRRDRSQKDVGARTPQARPTGPRRSPASRPGSDFAALAGADLVIEAVFEDRAIKEDVIRRAEAVLPPDAIFGSNTSTLPITSLAAAASRPANFIGIHFFSPVEKMMLVEIILGKKTGDAALARALDFVRAIRKTPIVVNDSRGFYTSRVVGTYIAEGHRMLTEGVPAAMIENVARMAGMPVGPLVAQRRGRARPVAEDHGRDAERPRRSRRCPRREWRLIDEMVEPARPARPEERQGLLRLSRQSRPARSGCGRSSPSSIRRSPIPTRSTSAN